MDVEQTGLIIGAERQMDSPRRVRALVQGVKNHGDSIG